MTRASAGDPPTAVARALGAMAFAAMSCGIWTAVAWGQAPHVRVLPRPDAGVAERPATDRDSEGAPPREVALPKRTRGGEPAATAAGKAPGAVVAPPSAPEGAQPEAGRGRAKAMAQARECFRSAQAAYVAGDLGRALEGFSCAYRAAPSPELRWNLARVFERMGEAEQSIRHYQAYLDASPTTPKERKAVEARIEELRALRQRQLAPLEMARPSADTLSSEARVFYDRGVKLYRAGEYRAAMAAFSAALKMSSAPELHFNLAVVSERMGRPQQAMDHYRAYLAARPRAGDRDAVESRISLLQSR